MPITAFTETHFGIDGSDGHLEDRRQSWTDKLGRNVFYELLLHA